MQALLYHAVPLRGERPKIASGRGSTDCAIASAVGLAAGNRRRRSSRALVCQSRNMRRCASNQRLTGPSRARPTSASRKPSAPGGQWARGINCCWQDPTAAPATNPQAERLRHCSVLVQHHAGTGCRTLSQAGLTTPGRRRWSSRRSRCRGGARRAAITPPAIRHERPGLTSASGSPERRWPCVARRHDKTCTPAS